MFFYQLDDRGNLLLGFFFGLGDIPSLPVDAEIKDTAFGIGHGRHCA